MLENYLIINKLNLSVNYDIGYLINLIFIRWLRFKIIGFFDFIGYVNWFCMLVFLVFKKIVFIDIMFDCDFLRLYVGLY